MLFSATSVVFAAPASAQDTAPGGFARVLDAQIFVRERGFPLVQERTFEVPGPGPVHGVLRLFNGAKLEPEFWERVRAADIMLNGRQIVGPGTFNQLSAAADVPVQLREGDNTIAVRLRGRPDQRIALRIEIPADRIALEPVLEPAVVGEEPVRAAARVTARGLPVENAAVRFELEHLGPVSAVTDTTSAGGIATASLAPTKAGSGSLRASLVEAPEVEAAETEVIAVDAAVVAVAQRPSSLKITVGESARLSLKVQVLRVENGEVRVRFSYNLAADDLPDGAQIVPPDDLVVTAPGTAEVEAEIMGVEPGQYTLTTTATVDGSLETHQTVLPVEVAEVGAPDPLTLSPPAIDPSGFPPSDTNTPVVFRTLITGTSTPPDVIYVDEVSADGKKVLKAAVAELRDTGIDADDTPGDGFYAGKALVASPRDDAGKLAEGQKYYRLRAEYGGEVLTSEPELLAITTLPLDREPPAGPRQLVENPVGRGRVFAGELLIRAAPSVSPAEMRNIVADVGSNARITQFMPPLNLYVVAYEAPETSAAVKTMIAAFEPYLTVGTVKSVSPNLEITYAVTPTLYSGEPTDEDGACSDQYAEDPCKWHTAHAGIDDVWSCDQDGDNCTLRVPQQPDWSKVKVGVIEEEDGDHKPRVEGLVRDSAKNTDLVSRNTTRNLQDLAAAIDALLTTTNSSARIINISWSFPDGQYLLPALKRAVIDNNRLITAAVGNNNPCNEPADRFPAAFNDDGRADQFVNLWGGNDVTVDHLRQIRASLFAVGAIDIAGAEAQDMQNTDRVGSACSNPAGWVDILAPGKNVLARISSTEWAITSGTSFATPMVAGAAAVVWAQNPDWDPDGVHDRLLNAQSRETCPSGKKCLDLCRALDVEVPSDLVGKTVSAARTELEALTLEVNVTGQGEITEVPDAGAIVAGCSQVALTAEPEPVASIDIEARPANDQVANGGAAKVDIIVTNTGTVSLTNVTVNTTLVAGEWAGYGPRLDCDHTIGVLEAARSTRYSCSEGAVIDDVTVSATATGSAPGNETISDSVTVDVSHAPQMPGSPVLINVYPELSVSYSSNDQSTSGNIAVYGRDVSFEATIGNRLPNASGTFSLSGPCERGRIGDCSGEGQVQALHVYYVPYGGDLDGGYWSFVFSLRIVEGPLLDRYSDTAVLFIPGLDYLAGDAVTVEELFSQSFSTSFPSMSVLYLYPR